MSGGNGGRGSFGSGPGGQGAEAGSGLPGGKQPSYFLRNFTSRTSFVTAMASSGAFDSAGALRIFLAPGVLFLSKAAVHAGDVLGS